MRISDKKIIRDYAARDSHDLKEEPRTIRRSFPRISTEDVVEEIVMVLAMTAVLTLTLAALL